MTWRRGALAAPLLIALALFAAAPAYASHTLVQAQVNVTKSAFENFSRSATVGCSTTNCIVQVPLPRREYGRFNRWCGPSQFVIVSAGSFDASFPCSGSSGPWVMTVRGILGYNCGTGTFQFCSTTHPDGAVTVTIHPTKDWI